MMELAFDNLMQLGGRVKGQVGECKYRLSGKGTGQMSIEIFILRGGIEYLTR